MKTDKYSQALIFLEDIFPNSFRPYAENFITQNYRSGLWQPGK